MRNKVFKTRLPDIYYGRSYIKCYNFYQYCKDYCATTGAMGFKRSLFTTSLFQNRTSIDSNTNDNMKEKVQSLLFGT